MGPRKRVSYRFEMVFVLTILSVFHFTPAYSETAALQKVASTPLASTSELFSLTTHMGDAVSDADFRGSYMLVYFGYTHCPDICPTDLAVISEAIDIMGEAGTNVQPLFITLDPERDNVERMADYISHFHPRFLALTGSAQEITDAANGFGARSSKSYAAGTDQYIVNHSSYAYFVGADGNMRLMFKPGITNDVMAAAILKNIQKK